MLMLTDDAAHVLQELEAIPEAGTLRISGGLELALADEPEPGDRVMARDGGRIYLAREAIAAVDDKVLDAHLDDERVHFEIRRASTASLAA